MCNTATTRPSGSTTSSGARSSTGCDTRVVIVTSHHLNNEPRETLRRIRAALVDCGVRRVRRQFKPEWERYFRARP